MSWGQLAWLGLWMGVGMGLVLTFICFTAMAIRIVSDIRYLKHKHKGLGPTDPYKLQRLGGM